MRVTVSVCLSVCLFCLSILPVCLCDCVTVCLLPTASTHSTIVCCFTKAILTAAGLVIFSVNHCISGNLISIIFDFQGFLGIEGVTGPEGPMGPDGMTGNKASGKVYTYRHYYSIIIVGRERSSRSPW